MEPRPIVSFVAGDALASTNGDTANGSHSRGTAVGHSIHWPQNHELAERSIPDLLTIVSQNALLVIPAERCVVFMYDKATNLLTAQVSCGGRVVQAVMGASVDGANSQQAEAEDSQEEEEELSFPPVMGLVSACFLQRRCMRMQEPNLHKSFHREYDVPNDMTMNSIIVAPVTLHHRTVGVIELLNRIDPEAPVYVAHEPTQDEQMANILSDGKTVIEEENEVKLTRTKVVQQRARIGFNAKDEQKMIQFTSHVAQLLDNKLKLLAQAESTAKFREEQAKTAMELLEMMNQKLEYHTSHELAEQPQRMLRRRSSSTIQAPPVEWTPEQLNEEIVAGSADEESALEDAEEARDQVFTLSDVDMMKVMVGISRTQAIFRGHHLRKVHRLSEALQQHRIMRRRVKSALVIQRATRRFLARRWRKKRRNAVWTMVRAIKSYQMRAALAERIEIKKRQKRKSSVLVVAKPRQGVHHKLEERDVHKFRERYASAVRIQQQFRGHKARKQIETIIGFKDLTKGLKNIVKLQSILRGTIARKQVDKIREEKRTARAANIVCMLLASTESAIDDGTFTTTPDAFHVPISRDCLYLLPALPNGAHVVANRIAPSMTRPAKERNEDVRSESRDQQKSRSLCSYHTRRQRLGSMGSSQETSELGGINNDSWLAPATRPLAPCPLASPRMLSERPALEPHEAQLTRAELSRRHPDVIFEIDSKKARRCPPGVQHADDWLPRRPQLQKSRRQHHDADEWEVNNNSTIVDTPSHFNLSTKQLRQQAAVDSRRVNCLPFLTSPKSPTLRPLIPRSNQLQVCFVPASNTPRSIVRPLPDGILSARPPTQPRMASRSPLQPTRPFTTR